MRHWGQTTISPLLFAAALFTGTTALAGTGGLLFAEETPLQAVLTAPLAQVYKQKDLDKRIYMDGQWSYKLADETVQRLDVIHPKVNIPQIIAYLVMWDDARGVIDLLEHDMIIIVPQYAEAGRLAPEPLITKTQLVPVVVRQDNHIRDQQDGGATDELCV